MRCHALRALTIGLVLALAAAAPAAEPIPLGPCGPIDRPYDSVELTGSQLHRLGNVPIARLGLLAFHGSHAAPIPFQVDERTGGKLALPDGPEPTRDDPSGVLDSDDLLVFMACDAGERGSAAALDETLGATGSLTAWRELRIEDPVRHASGFVYLVVAEHPPTTDRRYVAYEPRGDLVRAARYRVGLVHALPTYFALAPQGSPGPNLIDGLRLRAEATLRADLMHWTLNEQQGHHELIAWKVGPVRVIRRSRHQVDLGLGIRLTAGLAHTYFYAQRVFGPGSLKLPFSPGLLFNDIRAFGGADGRDLRGWRYYSVGTPPQGFRIDGHTDAAESAFDANGDWFVLAGRDAGLLFVTRLSENLANAIPLRLVYRDDAKRPYPPETSPGTVPLVGYEGRGVERLPRGRYTFQLHVFVLGPYGPGDERRLMGDLDTPLTAAVTAEGPPRSAP